LLAAKQMVLQDVTLLATVAKVTKSIVDALLQGNTILLCGNGGSADRCMAYRCGSNFDRLALPALAQQVNIFSVTSIATDYGFNLVLSRRIEAMA
jgi:D-sedoheptulose 7-phosphate isomerase